MLALLKERLALEGEGGKAALHRRATDGGQFRSSDEEIRDLRLALRESRARLRRSALESTRRIAALSNEVSRLSVLCASYRQQIFSYESGAAIVELGCKLMQLSEKNEQLSSDAHRLWTLERTIEAAHAEYSRLSRERDSLAEELSLNKLEQLAIVCS
ncbi:hypothetical protein [Ferribacterium limneticum]|uniref:hypothetical protein n=1 Tax=Ferribacterium limneticum TaxID=76259 RepID=UPI001CFA63DF|nr:hypothetical protein [Ferribacterium limneticum]UCV27772.1 hypothetical protein KI617_16160 [Ferribacterium limneticum]UCV31689.1 hypothetical protein KI608_16160 [Ferribacterium limneticum]